jgi:hypothetical protein
MVQFFHNLSLVDNGLNLLFSGQFILAHDLHGVKSTCIFFSNQDDPGECSPSNDFDLLKVMPGHFQITLSILRK